MNEQSKRDGPEKMVAGTALESARGFLAPECVAVNPAVITQICRALISTNSELSTARAELRDARMMLRAALRHDLQPSGKYDKAYVMIRGKPDPRVTPVSITLDVVDGIPVLTPAARRALEPEAHGEDERYDCSIHGAGDGPDCPRC